jgi:hypothetical protein
MDAEGDRPELIDSRRVMMQGGRSREFFLFEDHDAAESWLADGATAGNANRMLHFLVDEGRKAALSPRQVTMVCDANTAEMRRLAGDLLTSFRGSRRLHVPQANRHPHAA